LHKAVRHVGTHEYVSVSTRTDVWVYVLGEVLFLNLSLRFRTTVPCQKQGTEGC